VRYKARSCDGKKWEKGRIAMGGRREHENVMEYVSGIVALATMTL
jgi:hypothetical protein